VPVEPAWNEYYTDEMDAAWLYRALARVERNVQRRTIFENLARVEDAHVERWRSLFHRAWRRSASA
jgi:rubrerythrin